MFDESFYDLIDFENERAIDA
jgi:hypothetical protein